MSDWSSLPGGARNKLKIIFLGDQAVGKSSIIDKYIKEQFDNELNPTVGIDFHIKNVTWGGKNYRLQLWDTAGQQRFRSLIPSYLKDANCALLVFDITKSITFQNIKIWQSMFQQYKQSTAVKILVGNKSDLKSQRVITQDQGKQMAKRHKAKYIQVSAKTSQKLIQLFQLTISAIQQQNQNTHTIPVVQLGQNQNKEQKNEQINENKFKINIKDQNHNIVNTQKKQQKKTKQKSSCC